MTGYFYSAIPTRIYNLNVLPRTFGSMTFFTQMNGAFQWQNFMAAVSIIVWYISSTLYVDYSRRSMKDGISMSLLTLSHALPYFMAVLVWHIHENNTIRWGIIKEITPTLAATAHIGGTIAALYSFWLLGGADTQLVKMLEPILVVILCHIMGRTQIQSLNFMNKLGAAILFFAVFMRIAGTASAFTGAGISLLVLIWYPLRNVTWKSTDRECSAVFLLLVSILWCLIDFKTNLHCHQSVNAILAGLLFATYQLASISVLELTTPQIHSALNAGKRCIVIGALSYLELKKAEIPVYTYAAAMIGSSLLAYKSKPDFSTRNSTSSDTQDRFPNWYLFAKIMLACLVTICASGIIRSENHGLIKRPVVFIRAFYNESLVSAVSYSMHDMEKYAETGNSGNHVWSYGASSLVDTDQNVILSHTEFPFRLTHPSGEVEINLVMIPVANNLPCRKSIVQKEKY
ncbi:hypothetical protein SARC_13698, partial [Sphaeroforma arctica JP610]